MIDGDITSYQLLTIPLTGRPGFLNLFIKSRTAMTLTKLCTYFYIPNLSKTHVLYHRLTWPTAVGDTQPGATMS